MWPGSLAYASSFVVGDRAATTGSTPWYRRAGRSLGRIDPLIADTLLALVLAVPLLIDLSDTDVPGPPLPFRGADLLGYVLVALLVAPLALRRRYPSAVFGVILAASVATALIAYRPVSYGFGLIVATYTVARHCDRKRSFFALFAALAFSVFVKVRFILAGVDIAIFDWPLDTAYIAGGWFLGDSIRARTRQATELERSREALARQAVEREHLRIARELHDSTGHSLSVMVLYAGAAERLRESQPERAQELLESVTTVGREALTEMDELVRVLRDEPSKTPGVNDVEALATEFRGLGLSVDVIITGSPRPLPRVVDLSAYRIAQEALTNTLKHARAASAQLCLEYGPDALSVTVIDDGDGCTEADVLAAERHGLTGMKERAASLGGELRAGNASGGSGFAVHARIPLAGEGQP